MIDYDVDSTDSSDNYDGEPEEKQIKLSSKTTFKDKVLDIFKKVVAGEYALSGKLENAPPVVINIKNAKDEFIKFPLHKREVEEIIECFTKAPFGKGTETVIDPSVRNSFQLSPEAFQILNPDWDDYMKNVLQPRIIEEMALEFSFVADLYKLLLYTPGSFFKPHRDSEKVNGMFATLVIQLPSKHEGGQLVIRHDGKTKTIDFSSSNSTNNSFSTFFSVFYCDCEHEILPVTDGYRVCLIYNLIAQKSDTPLAPRNHDLEMELIKVVENWATERKLVYALTHQYSQSSLLFERLKTTDKGVASVLKNIAKAADLMVFLAIFDKDRYGVGDGDQDQCDGCYNCNCNCCNTDFLEDHDYDEFSRISYKVKNFVSICDGETLSASNLKVNFNKEVIPDDCFDNLQPYKKICAHTGNEGVQLEKHFRMAAIVFWPRKIMAQVLNKSVK